MARRNNQKKDHRHYHHEPAYPSYSGVRKSRLEARMRKKYGDNWVDGIRAEVMEEKRAAKEAKEAAAKGPSPGQSIRRSELLAEKTILLKQFTTLNIQIRESKEVVDRAVAQMEKVKGEKRGLEEKYSNILAELGSIPAELSSPGGVMLGAERDVMKEEDDARNITKQEDGSIIKEEVGGVSIKEEGDIF